ncbi:SlyX family protein [Pistricoccus aurantiacus]|nr:SlyX family protein [Pistricoccus aurantiacus]
MTNRDSLASREARLEARLIDLESRLAYQEHWLDALDKTLTDQHRRLETLERLGELLRQRLREQQQALASHDGEFQPRDETPPHY